MMTETIRWTNTSTTSEHESVTNICVEPRRRGRRRRP